MQLAVAGTYSKETHEGRGAVPGGALVLLGSNNDGRGLKEEGIPIKGNGQCSASRDIQARTREAGN